MTQEQTHEIALMRYFAPTTIKKLDGELQEQIKYLKTSYPRMSAAAIYRQLRDNGSIRPDALKTSDPYELEVTARHSSFHILCGKHEYGSFICIPNWNIGTELAGLSDSFWNQERLTTYYPELSPVDVISIVASLVKLNEYISFQGKAG